MHRSHDFSWVQVASGAFGIAGGALRSSSVGAEIIWIESSNGVDCSWTLGESLLHCIIITVFTLTNHLS